MPVPFFKSVQDLDRFVRRATRPVRGVGGVEVQDGDGGLVIISTRGLRGQIDQAVQIPIKLTAAGGTPGWYEFAEQEWNAAGQAWQEKTNGLTHAMLGEARELNLTGSLVTGSSSQVYYLRPSVATTSQGVRIWEFTVSAAPSTPGLFPVKVQQTGGANGTASSAPTWTYTVRSLEWNGSSGGTVLGTSVALARPRENGLFVAQSGSTGFGLAFRDETNTLRLWDAGERRDVQGCTGSTP